MKRLINIVLILSGFVTGIVVSNWGFVAMAWASVFIALPALLLPLFGPTDDPSRVADHETPPFLRSIAMTFANGPFRVYVTSQLLFLLGLMMIVPALPYIAQDLLGASEGEAGLLSGVALLTGLLFVPVVLRIANQRGQKAAYLFSMLWFAGATPLLALMGLFGHGPAAVWLARGLMLVSGIAVGGLFALPYGILAEVTEHDRHKTGLERQGMFFCVQGLILKLAWAGGPAIVLALIGRFPEHTRAALMSVGPLAGVCALAAYLVFRSFPEDEVRAAAQAVQAGEQGQGAVP